MATDRALLLSLLLTGSAELASAKYNLGLMYYTGRGTAQDFTLARYWLEKAAQQGHADAAYQLGDMYQAGQGVPQDSTLADAWYRQAAVHREENENAIQAK